jgi:TRAP-type uncharacterized transport system substrate-binding protein
MPPTDHPPLARRDLWRIGALIALAAAACLWVSFRFLEPIPPRQIVIASGPEGSLYHRHALLYKAALEREGVTLVERTTEGAGENLGLLGDPASGVDIAFVQGGQADTPGAKGVVMLASLYYQPLWIFVRRGEGVETLNALANRRISTGMPGSGSHALGEPLLAANGVTAANATLMPVPTDRARGALEAREVDAALMVGGIRTSAIQAALADPALELVSLVHADAFAQRYPYLTRRTLRAGAIAFVPLLPAKDVALVSTEAMLAARHDIHPAIVNLLLEVLRDNHDDQGFFESPGEFPNVDQVDLPVSPDAVRHRRFGPSLLYRYLPFWVATFVERFIVVVVPLLVVIVPLVNYLPQLLRWRVRSRIYRWYGELALLERDVRLRTGTPPIERWLSDLERIQRSAERVATPASLASEAYTLREHIELVRRAVMAKAAASTAPGSS